MYEGFQISRHWRLNPVRYRLQGVRYKNGEVSLQNRPTWPPDKVRPEEIKQDITTQILAQSALGLSDQKKHE